MARLNERAAASKVASVSAAKTAADDGAGERIPERRELAEAGAALAKARAERDRMQAERDEAALRLARTEIRAPAGGVVMQRLAEPGMAVPLDTSMGPSQAHVMTLYDPARLQVRVDVPLADAGRIGVGAKARVVCEVLPDRTFDGEVTRVVHSADIQKNTLQVKVAIRDPAPELKPEMLARVQFLAGAPEGAAKESVRMFVPERLLAGGANVWVVDTKDGTAALRPVTLGGTKQDGWVEVTGGVTVGDELIDADPATLRQGLRVKVAGESRRDDHARHGGR
ncbi:MAG: hypothetical protein HMLKMBBP_03348 [Planctomycetes bacterium]|nr:hypothetical protein [Planctomycetota bacterium]